MGLLRKAVALYRQLTALDPATVEFQAVPGEVKGERIFIAAWTQRRQMQLRQEYESGPWTWILVDHEGFPLDFSAEDYADQAACERGARARLSEEFSSADAA